jgi:hypothetical protein
MKKMAPLSTINDHGITSKSAFIILKNITFFGHEKQCWPIKDLNSTKIMEYGIDITIAIMRYSKFEVQLYMFCDVEI